MSFAEDVGEAALIKGVEIATRRCWRCEGNKILVTHRVSEHGNLIEDRVDCDECGATGKIIPHWGDVHVQCFVMGAAIGAMNQTRSDEAYDLAWEMLDWILGYLARCVDSGLAELRKAHGDDAPRILRQALGVEPCDHDDAPLAGALTTDEIAELLKS